MLKHCQYCQAGSLTIIKHQPNHFYICFSFFNFFPVRNYSKVLSHKELGILLQSRHLPIQES